MTANGPPRVRVIEINEQTAGQRIDNHLIKILKGVPRPRIYKALRKGEVRVNSARVRAPYHLRQGDKVRIPPIQCQSSHSKVSIPPKILDHIPVIYEDDYILIVNKPAGLAVHGGSGIAFGLIEALRKLCTELTFLELVHRLDRETSGCLMLAKNRRSLINLHEKLSTERTINKFYTALVKDAWIGHELTVNHPLDKCQTEDAGHARMVVNANGQEAISIIKPLEILQQCSLLNIELKTGRMHQARVHCASLGYPIAGDRLYGDEGFNLDMRKMGLRRMFLHANRIKLNHPITGARLDVQAELSKHLRDFLHRCK